MIKTTVKIDGMMCGMCEAHINDVFRRDFKIKKVTSSHAKGESVVISDCELDENKLKKAIADVGYTFVSMKSEEYVKKGLFGILKG